MFTPKQERAMDCREWYSEKYGIEPCTFWQKREDK